MEVGGTCTCGDMMYGGFDIWSCVMGGDMEGVHLFG